MLCHVSECFVDAYLDYSVPRLFKANLSNTLRIDNHHLNIESTIFMLVLSGVIV